MPKTTFSPFTPFAAMLGGLATVLTLAACAGNGQTPAAPGAPAAAAAAPGGLCNAQPAQVVLGQSSTASVVESARARSGARMARILRPGQTITKEFNPQRLSLQVDGNGRIIAARWGRGLRALASTALRVAVARAARRPWRRPPIAPDQRSRSARNSICKSLRKSRPRGVARMRSMLRSIRPWRSALARPWAMADSGRAGRAGRHLRHHPVRKAELAVGACAYTQVVAKLPIVGVVGAVLAGPRVG